MISVFLDHPQHLPSDLGHPFLVVFLLITFDLSPLVLFPQSFELVRIFSQPFSVLSAFLFIKLILRFVLLLVDGVVGLVIALFILLQDAPKSILEVLLVKL